MMPELSLQEIAFATGSRLVRGDGSGRCKGVFTDTRKPERGALFIALVGEHHDASAFAVQAARDGAAAVLVPERAASRVDGEIAAARGGAAVLAANDTGRALALLGQAWRGQHHAVKVVAVSGSTGKTSTKELVAAVLGRAGATLKTEGNLNNEIGVPLTLLRLEADHRYAVVECGMNHLGEIARLAHLCDPDVALVTNVGPVHLEGVGSIEGVASAKGELFHALRPDGIVVANADDPRVLAQARLAHRRLVTWGASTLADVRLLSAHHGGKGLVVELQFSGRPYRAELQLIGTHNGHNAAAAAAAAFALGLSPEEIVLGLGQARTPGRRMRPVEMAGGGLLIDDCYNANPSSSKAALLTLTHLVRGKGRAVAVLGDMLELGPTELDLHRDVGRFAAGAGLSLLVCFGERARAIGEGAIESGIPQENVAYTDDPAEAVRLVLQHRRPQDVVLVKGSRGMKMERISDPLAGVVPPQAGT
ncbi:MAG: UDP-N-acetylmuramoyl-tripeptide--D-alanyl-D-alanine ligase [Myxococcales bacterium]